MFDSDQSLLVERHLCVCLFILFVWGVVVSNFGSIMKTFYYRVWLSAFLCPRNEMAWTMCKDVQYVFTRYCKTVIGLNKSVSNISSLSELDVLPVPTFTKVSIMVYAVQLNSQNMNPLIKKSHYLNLDKILLLVYSCIRI